MSRAVWAGPHDSVTHFGYPLDLCKSSMQKAIRRGEVYDALTWGFEMFNLDQVGGVSARTNIINRLAVSAAEDIGPANPSLVVDILRSPWEQEPHPDVFRGLLVRATQSPKSRLGDYLWTAFANTEGRKEAARLGLLTEVTVVSWEGWLPGDFEDPEPRRLLNSFASYLSARNCSCLFYLKQYMTYSKLKIVPRGRIRRPAVLIFEVLKPLLPPDWEGVLRDAFLRMSEWLPFVVLAVILAVYPKYPPVGTYSEVLTPTLEELRNHQYTLTVRDYAVDKHTQAGRTLGRGRREFALVGSVVTNEDPEFSDETLREIFIRVNRD